MTNPLASYGHQWIDDDDIAAVVAALRGDLLTTGPLVGQFQTDLANLVAAPHAVACNSGTAALHLAMMALDIGPGDAAVVPAITFAATANAARFVGAEAVFADVDPATGLMTPQTLSEAVARARAAGLRPRVAIPVHLNGRCCDMTALAAVAAAEEMAIVEDACHALGSSYRDGDGVSHPAGACHHSALACFSFHPVKTITTGEGGAVTTRDPDLAKRLARLCSHGLTRDPETFENLDMARAADGSVNSWYHEFHEIAPNYRISDINCALGRSQLAKLRFFAARRSALVREYSHALASLAPTVAPVARDDGDTAWHLCPVLIDFDGIGRNRGEVMKRLRAEGVGTQVHYIPVHHQPYYRRRNGMVELAGADRYYHRTLSLPLHPALTEADVRRVADALRLALQ